MHPHAGLSEPAYWGSWAVTHWSVLAASGLLCALAGTYPFEHSSLGLMLAFFWLYAGALVSFGYWLSTLFSSSRVAGTATQLLYALAMVPGFVMPIVSLSLSPSGWPRGGGGRGFGREAAAAPTRRPRV